MVRSLLVMAALLFALPTMEAKAVDIKDPENTLVIELTSGEVVIEMLPDVAPLHVARIKELASSGQYDGVAFHRVIEGFMAQTGDPRGDGTGGSGKKLAAEFSDAPFETGTVGMARSASPDSGDSQFFICYGATPHLNGQYTVWGQVVEGMGHVEKIKLGDSRRNGAVTEPDRIVRMQVAADATES
jgi:peptidylprolyl isomerase